MTGDARVFVIILNWNRKDATIACLESVYRIDYSPLEVIVVDNGSTDGSVAAIKSRFKDVIIIEERTNLGFCAGNNIAIDYGMRRGADLFLVLNNDTLVEPSILRELKASLDSDSSIAAVNPVIVQGASREHLCGTRIDWGSGGLCAQYKQDEIERNGRLADIDFATWCAVLISRVAVEKIGVLDEEFFCYYEDIDWGVRCRRSGMRTVLHPNPLVYHEGSLSSGGAFSPMACYYLFRNRMILMRKHAFWARKLQFCAAYIKDFTRQYLLLMSEGSDDKANAVVCGVWSALMGCTGEERATAPENIKKQLNPVTRCHLSYLTLKAVFKRSQRCRHERERLKKEKA
jgi:GT2 family glycosyltransferase